MRSSWCRSLSACLLAGASIAAPRPALAIPPYPGDLQAALKLDYTPQCALCHEGGVTGLGTVTTPFGVSMRDHGLTDDPSTFAGALSEMEQDKVDSVGRGFSDIEALKMGIDPDAIPANGMPTSPSPAAYGCSRIAPGGAKEPASPFALAALASLAVLARRRRRAI